MERDFARTLRGKISPRNLSVNVSKVMVGDFEHTRNNPSNWAPGASEEEDVNAHKCDQSLLCGLVLNTSDGSGDSNDKLAHRHTNGTEEQKIAASPLLNEIQTRESGSNVNAGSNHADDEGVLDTGVLEKGGTIVEDEVHTSELLESLECATGCEALSKAALEAVEVGSLS